MMEERDTIGYKQWLENLQEPAPEGAWHAIEDALDIDQTWNAVSEELDLEDVWQGVQSELNAPVATASNTSMKFPKIFWIAAGLLLLTLTTPITEEQRVTVQNPISSQREPVIQAPVEPQQKNQTQPRFPQSGLITPVPENNATHPSSPVTRPGKKDFANEPIASEILAAPALTEITDQAAVSSTPLSVDSFKKAVALAEDSIFKEIAKDSLVARETNQDSVDKPLPVKKSMWQIGLIGAVKNTWLINPETKNGLKRKTLADTELTFGKDFGLTVQRTIGTRSSLQLEYYFYSEIGQRYHEYINALYQAKNVRLKYQKIQLVYRRNILPQVFSSSLYAVGGIRISKLTMADVSIGGEHETVTRQYTPWDVGVLGGVESEIRLNRFVLVPGIRASYGMRNIFDGNKQTPSEFNRTNTATVGITLGVKYDLQ